MTGSRIGTSLFRAFAVASISLLLGNLSVRADLLLYYDFNDDSDPLLVEDLSGEGNDAEIFGAEYTEDGLGWTGEDGDLAMDFLGANDSAHIDVLTALDGAFDTINENDSATITMWVFGGESQPHNNSTFWFFSEVANGEGRVLQAHIPWSNSNIYFDVGGCCAANQRINGPTAQENFKGRWNHYAFVKDEGTTFIYINGEVFLESAPDVIGSIEDMPITNVVFGSKVDGVTSYNGLIDEITVWDEALNEDEIIEVMEDGPDVGGTEEPRFVRGDADANDTTNISDVVFVLNFLFTAEGKDPPCMDAADSDDTGTVNLTDAVYVLSFLFSGGADPLAPFPECGPDPTADGLSCAAFPPCP